MRVITLGTGAGRPTLQRNASATALEYEGDTFLFDCGEGTQLQLMKTAFHWGKIRAVFIGHLHGDHVNGLPGLLGSLSLSDREAPMQVFGPKGIRKFLNNFFKCQATQLRFPMEVVEISTSGVLWDAENYTVEAHPLEHTLKCWGYVFREKDRPGEFDAAAAEKRGVPVGPVRGQLVKGETVKLEDGTVLRPEDFVGPPRPGRSVAYCLDTRPCRGAVALAEGVDLLIHEATFGAEFQQEAHDWGHSTAADAARTAREAGARQLILTHISQRYPDASILLKEAREIFPNVRLASDLEVFSI